MALNNYAYSRSETDNNYDPENDFRRAIKIQDSIGDFFSISRSRFNYAKYYLAQQDTATALSIANSALKYAELADNNDRTLETLLLLSKLDPNNASAYNQRYITLNDSLQQKEREIRDKFARIRFETDEYIAENEILYDEKRLWTGIAVAIFLLGGSAFVIFDQRAKNVKLRFQQAQTTANQEIFNLMMAQSKREEEAKKSEQKRISEELHDGVLGKMLGARMVLTGLSKKQDENAENKKEEALNALQEVEKEIRLISHELSHSAYQKIHNFILTLQELTHAVSASSKIQIDLSYDTDKEWDSLTGEIKINVYRIIQECLQNCVKHAQCAMVLISLGFEDHGLVLTISDNGKGFKVNKRKRGIGMRNIASRVDKLNGTWRIESTPGQGTEICIEMPVPCTKQGDNKQPVNELPPLV